MDIEELKDRLECWLIDNVGYRCDDEEPTCFACQKWAQFDALFSGLEDFEGE